MSERNQTGAMMYQRRDAGRGVVVAVLVVGFVLSIFARSWALGLRAKPSSAAASGATSGNAVAIGRFDSYTLALLLGGLRGPLVMVLWTSSEQQKSERNLADFDTKVEWIRLLQPEFDSVHIFQIWNKAYNISVQMASRTNKYATILDAIDYAEKVDDERPNNINILVAAGQTWFDKLGNSHEKPFYRAQVRAQSLPHGSASRLKRDDAGFRRTELDAVLDGEGNLLPQFLVPTLKEPLGPPVSPVVGGGDTYDGSRLQYLKQWQPFPQGVSPLAFGYNFYKRAQVLQTNGKQRHLQLSDLVIDSRPALSLKTWSEEEWERARRFEIAAFGIEIPPTDQRIPLELPSAEVKLTDAIKDRKALEAAIFCYERSSALAGASLKEYERHLQNYKQQLLTYRSHQDFMRANIESALADKAFLEAMLLPAGAERTKLEALAVSKYRIASDLYALSLIRYFTDDAALTTILKPGVTKYNLDFDPAHVGELTQIAGAAETYARNNPQTYDQFGEDRLEFVTYIVRIAARLQTLGAQ